jgi:hypothetical protein
MKTYVVYGLIVLGAFSALLFSYLATANCCERLNVFAMVGLMKPG